MKIAINICTYNRLEEVKRNLDILLNSFFFNDAENAYYGNMHIFIVDNASNLNFDSSDKVTIISNRNTGGSGGFQRGLEEIRSNGDEYTHVIFMDDDVEFEMSAFYILFDFLVSCSEEEYDRPVAGRMLCKRDRNVQYTAADIWNKGYIKHVEGMRDISVEYAPGKVNACSGADYGGWWFCCFPFQFCKDNDIIPFFIHCDDVEYGLRCGRSPIIIEGVHVWHETVDNRKSSIIVYYDTRNSLFVNEIYGLMTKSELLQLWRDHIGGAHQDGDYKGEFYGIIALNDFMKGIEWLDRIDPEKHHIKLQRIKYNRLLNKLAWRYMTLKFQLFYKRIEYED